ncbi:thiamine diphosphate-binding protein [Trichodelitschia bisporula]|uniref:Thiamine diphosphate-binding protein n=1 Tax=Trichodelitschia bisporula TaxID=703511 RepID=A0A6G1I0P2_9PEZI|nr:thiamine diphosphate-binding protein [Trichodelitschia bisporula]
MYTTSFAFFEALWEAGITHCFVNLGSDHPSILEAMVKGQREHTDVFPQIITCPNEMVAMSMADGYARLTNKPQCVIVHVDVGTQGLGAAMHNAMTGRAPVLVFAGLSPYTQDGELRGSRTEFIHWMQDVPDQKQIVAQYCRYTAEIKTGVNVKQMVNRALSFAMSEPKGPVYLYGAREVMEQEIQPYHLDKAHWKPIEPAALPPAGVTLIGDALIAAQRPLLITGYSGRNPQVPGELVKLANTIKGLRVLDTGGSDMCFPADHPGWLSVRYGNEDAIRTADVILVLDCDVPWIPTQCKPATSARIYHIDTDPLKTNMPVFYINALARYRADAHLATQQLNSYISSSAALVPRAAAYASRWDALVADHAQRLQAIALQAQPLPNGHFQTPYLMRRLRALCPADTIWVVEAVTQTFAVADHIQACAPGSWFNCGGGGLGWSGGAALGIKLVTAKFVVQIVGDGTFLFSVPGSVYWIARRYGIPILTVVLNNKGWNAPRKSLLLVHPEGEGSRVSNEEINISFRPTPDYAGIAKAAAGGGIWAGRASTVEELERVLPEAVDSVHRGRAAVLDAQLDGSDGKFVAKI